MFSLPSWLPVTSIAVGKDTDAHLPVKHGLKRPDNTPPSRVLRLLPASHCDSVGRSYTWPWPAFSPLPIVIWTSWGPRTPCHFCPARHLSLIQSQGFVGQTGWVGRCWFISLIYHLQARLLHMEGEGWRWGSRTPCLHGMGLEFRTAPGSSRRLCQDPDDAAFQFGKGLLWSLVPTTF